MVDRDHPIHGRMGLEDGSEGRRGHDRDPRLASRPPEPEEERGEEHQVPEPPILTHDHHPAKRRERAGGRIQRRLGGARDGSEHEPLEPPLETLTRRVLHPQGSSSSRSETPLVRGRRRLRVGGLAQFSRV